MFSGLEQPPTKLSRCVFAPPYHVRAIDPGFVFGFPSFIFRSSSAAFDSAGREKRLAVILLQRQSFAAQRDFTFSPNLRIELETMRSARWTEKKFSLPSDDGIGRTYNVSSFLPNVFPFDRVTRLSTTGLFLPFHRSPTASIHSFHFLPVTFAPPLRMFFRDRGHVAGDVPNFFFILS